MKKFLSIFSAFVFYLLIPALVLPASMYWKSLASDCPVTTNNADKCFVVDDDSETMYTHTSGAWVAINSGIEVDGQYYGAGLSLTNGTDDWTSAINAAIVAAGRTPVLMPIGIYKTTAPIVLKEGTRLIGASRMDSNTVTGGTRIVHASTTLDNVFTVGEPVSGSYTYDIEVAHIGVYGNSNTNAIFNLNKVSDSHFHHMTLYRGAYGFWINYGQNNSYDHIQSTAHSVAGVVIGTTNGTTTQTFSKMKWQSMPWAMDIQVSAGDIRVNGGTILESLTSGGINMYWNASGISLYADEVYAEAVPDNVFRYGVDGTVTDEIGQLSINNCNINGSNNPYSGNAILVNGLSAINISNTKFGSYDNVLHSLNGTYPSWVRLYGNETWGNNRFLSSAISTAKTSGIYMPDQASARDMVRAWRFAIGDGTLTSKFFWSATASVADNSAITHGLPSAPTAVIATPSVDNEVVSVTALGASTFTVRIRKTDGSVGTTQTIYWIALK